MKMKVDKLRSEDIETPNGRLRFVWLRSGLSQREFAESLGLSLSGLNSLLGTASKTSKVSRSIALALEHLYRVNHQWILTGEGLRNFNPVETLDPWKRMILDFFEPIPEENLLEMILNKHENDEKQSGIFKYFFWANLEGKISPEDPKKINIRLNMLQKERRTSLKKLFEGIPWEADTDTSEETRMTRRLREEWMKIPSEKSSASDSIGKLLLRDNCQLLVMFLHFGEDKWELIRTNWRGYKNFIKIEESYFLIALEILKMIQLEIKELITASPEQIKFIEEVKPRHIKSEVLSQNEIKQLLKTHNKGEADGTDG